MSLVTANEAVSEVPALAGASGSVERKIRVAVGAIEGFLQRPLELTELVDSKQVGDGGAFHVLRHFPLVTVERVLVRGEGVPVETISPDTLHPIPFDTVWRCPDMDKAGKLFFGQLWPRCPFFVTYSGGYTPETVPEDLKEAVFMVLRRMAKSKALDELFEGSAKPSGPLVNEKTAGGWDREWSDLTEYKDLSKRVLSGFITGEIAGLIRKHSWQGLIS